MKRSVGGFLNSWPGAVLISAALAGTRMLYFDVESVRSALKDDLLPSVPQPVTPEHTGMADHTPEGVDRIFQRGGLQLYFFLLSPAAFGIESWTVGDQATYEYVQRAVPGQAGIRPDPVDSLVSIEVVGDIDASHAIVDARGVSLENQWLRISRLHSYRNRPTDRYGLMNPHDLRPSATVPLYEYQPGYIPMQVETIDLQGVGQLHLEAAGRGPITTSAGSFDCDIYTTWVAGAPVRIWASPEVGPIGIVKISSDREELVLAGVGPMQKTAPMNHGIEALLRGDSLIDQGCMSCHPDAYDCHTSLATPL